MSATKSTGKKKIDVRELLDQGFSEVIYKKKPNDPEEATLQPNGDGYNVVYKGDVYASVTEFLTRGVKDGSGGYAWYRLTFKNPDTEETKPYSDIRSVPPTPETTGIPSNTNQTSYSVENPPSSPFKAATHDSPKVEDVEKEPEQIDEIDAEMTEDLIVKLGSLTLEIAQLKKEKKNIIDLLSSSLHPDLNVFPKPKYVTPRGDPQPPPPQGE